MNYNGNQNGMMYSNYQSNVSNNRPNNKKLSIIVVIIAIIAVAIVFVLIINKKEPNSSENNSNNQNKEEIGKVDIFQANIYLLSRGEGGKITPTSIHDEITVKMGNIEVVGTILLIDEAIDGGDMLLPGDEGFVKIQLETPIAIQEGDSFDIYYTFSNGNKSKMGNGIVSDARKESSHKNGNFKSITFGQVDPNTNLTYDSNGAFFMYIADYFSHDGFVVVEGKILRGTPKVGDEVQILNLDGEILTTKIVKIEALWKDNVTVGDSANFFLENLSRDQIEVGGAMVKPNSMIATTDFEANIHVLSKNEGGNDKDISSSSSSKLRMLIGSRKLYGNIFTNSAIKSGEDGSISVQLQFPIAMEVGTEFEFLERGKIVAKGKVTKLN